MQNIHIIKYRVGKPVERQGRKARYLSVISYDRPVASYYKWLQLVIFLKWEREFEYRSKRRKEIFD